jgi:hypothetical protein
MLKTFSSLAAVSVLALSLSTACSHSGNATYVQQPPPPKTVVAAAAPSSAPAPVVSSTKKEVVKTNQTYSDTGWSLSVPSTLIRQPDNDSAFIAVSSSEDFMIGFDVMPEPDNDLKEVEMKTLMALSMTEINVDNGVDQKFGGYDGFVVAASKPANDGSGKLHLKTYVTVTNSYLFGLSCLTKPSADFDAAMEICDNVAKSVILTPSALPAITTNDSPAPVAPTTKKKKK